MTAQKAYALVTGASSGIGYQYARILAEKGYNLLIISNEESALEEKQQQLEQDYKVEVVALTRNLGTQDAAKELYDWCKMQNIEVEVLINNAGVYHDRDFLADTAAFNEMILNLHVTTPSMLIYYFAQDMVERHKGYILNMSSMSAWMAMPGIQTYNASKAFIYNFSKSLWYEFKPLGVGITVMAPGAVDTALFGLSPKLRKLAVNLTVSIPPEKLVTRALKKLFKNKKADTPGFLNWLATPLRVS